METRSGSRPASAVPPLGHPALFLRLSAAWLLPIAGEPIRDGAILIGTDGRVQVVGPGRAVPLPEGAREVHLPDAVLLPGLVNTHTHLELTGIGNAAAPDDFPSWIRGIRQAKERRTSEEYREAARAGLRECWRAGVTTVADTGDSGIVLEVLDECGGRGVVFHEVFGPHPDQAATSMALLERAVDRLETRVSERVRLGVSPHAPYSVSGPLYRAVARFAADRGLPIAVHLAESRAESRLIADSQGPFADAWRARGIPTPDDVRHLGQPLPVRTPVRWLDAFEVLGPETLCIHVVQADPADVAVLARRGVAIAHCPISNAAHGHGQAPLAEFLAAGIRVGAGTDSSASVGALDLFAELRMARAIGGLDATQALRLGTLDAAVALGVSDVGMIAPGAWADLVAVRLGDLAGAEGVAGQALDAGSAAVVATWVAGREVYRA